MREVKTVTIHTKNVYGNELCYPVCETAKLFAGMVGRKTLTTHDIKHIIALGYQLIHYFPEPTLPKTG